MKFIHTGDIHWGMTPDADKPWGSERTQAIKDTFKKIIAQAGKMQADCLFISGDLFHRQPLVRDLKEVNYLFTTIPNVKVILIAGNHDRIRDNYRGQSRPDPQKFSCFKLFLGFQRDVSGK